LDKTLVWSESEGGDGMNIRTGIQQGVNKILHYLKGPKKTAIVAKERLQIIIAHERNKSGQPDYLEKLQQDLLDVIARYVPIDREAIRIDLDRKDGCSILELNVTLPDGSMKMAAPVAG
jgi:cell division topological specificity factor